MAVGVESLASEIVCVSKATKAALPPHLVASARVLVNGVDRSRVTITDPPQSSRVKWGIPVGVPVVGYVAGTRRRRTIWLLPSRPACSTATRSTSAGRAASPTLRNASVWPPMGRSRCCRRGPIPEKCTRSWTACWHPRRKASAGDRRGMARGRSRRHDSLGDRRRPCRSLAVGRRVRLPVGQPGAAGTGGQAGYRMPVHGRLRSAASVR